MNNGWYCPGCESYHSPTMTTCPRPKSRKIDGLPDTSDLTKNWEILYTPRQPSVEPQPWPQDIPVGVKYKTKCGKCGATFEGGAVGYSCPKVGCPIFMQTYLLNG